MRIALLGGVLLGGCIIEADRDYAALYEGCGTNQDCRGEADACFRVNWGDGAGGMCSVYCETDADCPGDASCWELVGDPTEIRICYQQCGLGLGCDFGFTCAEARMGETLVDTICLP